MAILPCDFPYDTEPSYHTDDEQQEHEDALDDLQSIFREARKLVDTLNRFGNCLVPSIHDNGADTTAQERLRWLVDGAKEHYGMSLDDIQAGIDSL